MPKVPRSPLLLSFEQDWVRELQAGHKTKHTIRGYLQQFWRFLNWLSPDGKAAHCTTTVADVDRVMITTYFGWLYEHYSESTILHAYNALKLFFDLVIDYRDLEEGQNPLRFVDRPKPTIQPPEVLTEDHMKKLAATCERAKDYKGMRDYALIRVLASSGVRANELLEMEMDDVYLDEGIIVVRHAKGGRIRKVAIGVKTVRALGRYLHARAKHNHADLPCLWLSQRGKLAYNTLWGVINSRAKEAHLEGVHPHAFRHLFAHGYLAAGGQESALLQLAGWRDSKMLRERYGASLANERALAEHKKLGIGEHW